MQVHHLDRDSRAYHRLLTAGHSSTGDEDVPEGLRRKAVGPITMGRATPTENQTRCRGLNLIEQERRGDACFMCHVIMQ